MPFSEEQVHAWARQAYEQGIASFEVRRARCALLVIDMQDEFVRPGWTPYWVPEATRRVPAMRALVDCCRRVDVPVIYTVFSATHGFLDRPASGASMPNRYPQAAVPHDEWFRDGRVWHELEPRSGEIVIHKPSYGAFHDTALSTILRNLGRDTVVIAGTLSNYCCGTTARQAYERGFHVVFGSDVTATDDEDAHDAELRVLRKGFARVATGEEVAGWLTR
jgi:nicotinamidase-related amidase